MADRASDENTEPDLNWRRVPRRSSILKPTRPILESVENTTEDVTEHRRLSKRVSFSDTHQIKLFKCEISDEHGSGCDNTSQASSVFTAGDKTLPDNAAEDRVDEALQLLQRDHTPLEQSFYLAVDDINGSTEATSPTKRTSTLMEEAESCLVFGQLGNMSATSDGACYRGGLDKTTFAQCTLDTTCCSSRAINQTAAEFTQSVLADEMMETTMGATDHNQSAGTLPKTMFGDKSMETTIGAADHNQSAGTLPKTTFGDKSMEMTVFGGTSVLVETAENLSKTHIFAGDVMDITVGPQDSTRFGGNATVPLQDTMNMTCAVGSTSFAMGAADETDTGAVNSVGQTTVPAAETVAGAESPVGQHDVAAFLASFRKCDSAGPPGAEPLDVKWVDEAASPPISAPSVSCGSISKTSEPFDLAALVALNRCADASSLLGEDADCAEALHVQPDPALCSAIHSNTTHVGTQNAVEEMDSAHLSARKASMPADYQSAAMNVTGLDTFARLPYADDLSCADNIAPVELASDDDGNNHQVQDDSQAKLLTCGHSDALHPKTSLAVITSLQHLKNKFSDGPGTDIHDSGGSVPHAADTGGTMCRGNISNAGKTCLLPGAMDMTCTSPTAPTADTETASSGPAMSEQIENLATKTMDVMNVTCADPVGSTHPACSSTNPAWMTLHFKDSNMTREMNMTCVNTKDCSPIVEVMADLSTEPNEPLNKGASPRVADKSHRGTDGHSVNKAARLCRLEGANVVATGDIEADRDGNRDGTTEDARLDPQVSSATLLNATARGKGAVGSSCSLHLPAVCEVGFAAATAKVSEAMPQDLPVLTEMTAPSFLKTAPRHEKADSTCHCLQTVHAVNISNVSALLEMPSGYVSSLAVLDDVFSPEKIAGGNAHSLSCRASVSKSLSKVRRQMGSACRSRLASDQGRNSTAGVEVRGKHEQIVVPDVDAQQEQAVVSLSTSKKSFLAATSNSTVSTKKTFMGISNSAISEVNLGSTSQQLDVALEKRTMEDLAIAEGELQQTGATRLSPVTCPSATSAPDTHRIGASLSERRYDGSHAVKASTYVTDELAPKSIKFRANTELVRKSATFVVTPGKGTRPSATFSVSSPSRNVICIDDCTTVDEANKDVPLETEDCCTSSTPCLLAEQPAAAVHQSHITCSDEGTATSRSRKKLEFTAIQPRSSCNATEPRAHRNVASVSISSRTPSDMCRSQTLPNHGEASCREPHRALLTSPSKVLQSSTVSCADYGTMLMDITEPSLVADSLKTSSADSLQTSSCNETTGQPVCHTEVGEPTSGADASPSNSVFIPTNMFYSSSTKKRRKPPSTPSSTLSDKHKSTAKKRRLGKAAAKSSGSKSQYCSPVSTGKKRPPVPQERTSAVKSARKAPDGATSARKTTRQRTEPSRSTDADILRSVFPRRPKLRSPQKSPDASLAATDSSISLEWPELPDSVKLPDDLSIEALQTAADAALAKIAERSEELTGTDEVKLPTSSAERVVNLDDSDFEMSDPELDLTANIDILGIIDRLDDINAKQTLYWSFYDIPEETRKDWQLEERLLEKDVAVFSFIKGRVKLLVSLGDYVKLPDMEDKLTLARAAASGEVRHRTKFITGLQYKITCRPKAHFNKYLLHHHLQNVHSTDKLLQKYPTTDCLGKLLADLGNFFVRYRPLSWDLGILAKNHYYTFENSVASFQIIAPKHLIWFHLDLPIDLETYPNAVIVPSLRPYSEEFDVLATEKLRRITARVEPGTDYLIRMVGEIEEFLEK